MKYKILILASLLIAQTLLAYTSPAMISVPSKTERSIKSGAEDEWPDDYRMQRYHIDQQKDAYRQIESWRTTDSSTIAKKIHKKAVKDWPDDYRMQWHTIKQQLQAYNELNN